MAKRKNLGWLAALPLLVATYVGAELVTDSTPVPPAGTLGGPTYVLTGPDLDQWVRGRKIFDRDWDDAQGLGTPDLNGDSCRACHQTPVIGGSGLLDVNVFRFAFDNGGAGPYSDLPGGQAASKVRTPHVAGREEVHPDADVFEVRQTPIMFGIGLIDTISDATILGNEDPADLDGDGCRGIARLRDVGGGVFEVGKFGWKAQIPKVRDFTRDALGEEIGITVEDDGRGIGMLSDSDVHADPEVVPAEFEDLNFFIENLGPPPRAGGTDPAIAVGEALFTTIGCATCHIPSLPGSAGPVPLFSDLLLHDIHPADFRGMSEPGAGVGMYRTPPLWGLRTSAPYLHDGHATTIEDAILEHEDEATGARLAYEDLTVEQQDALLLFLLDL
jgi:hypothetical protein